MEQGYAWDKFVAHVFKKIATFLEAEILSPCSPETATGLYIQEDS
jgi:hypothetical protein